MGAETAHTLGVPDETARQPALEPESVEVSDGVGPTEQGTGVDVELKVQVAGVGSAATHAATQIGERGAVVYQPGLQCTRPATVARCGGFVSDCRAAEHESEKRCGGKQWKCGSSNATEIGEAGEKRGERTHGLAAVGVLNGCRGAAVESHGQDRRRRARASSHRSGGYRSKARFAIRAPAPARTGRTGHFPNASGNSSRVPSLRQPRPRRP